MSPVDKKVLDFIKNYAVKNECFPTIREICDGCNYSSSGYVHDIIMRLVDAGHVKIHPGKNRGITKVDESVTSIVSVVKKENKIPVVISWQGRQYVYDPAR